MVITDWIHRFFEFKFKFNLIQRTARTHKVRNLAKGIFYKGTLTIDAIVKSTMTSLIVIPAKTGILFCQLVMGSGVCRSDESRDFYECINY
jgi:hypothetical protein